MGIPYYFVSLIKAHRSIVNRVRARLEPNILAVDFNCLIHTYLDENRPIESIVEALDTLIEKTCAPRNYLYIAMDGLVPYAKIVQQRYRRFRIYDEPTPIFDKHQISPGTPYMKELHQAIKSKFPNAIISSTDEPGEGEHKLFEWMKTLKPDEIKETCVYGLDADLILLCLSQLNMFTRLYLLRENQSFDSKVEGYSILSINSLQGVIPIPIPQYIALCVLCFGNDFMPAIGMFSLREKGHERAMEYYQKAGNPNLLTPKGRYKFLKTAGMDEINYYKEAIKNRCRPAESAIMSPDGKFFEERYNLHLLDGTTNIEYVVQSFWKNFNWTLYYFTENKCLDWNWVYPYSEAPLISQIIRYHEQPVVWKPETPKFTVTKQLQFILPQESLHRAKKRAMYPDEKYDESKDNRMPWMRKFEWECEPRISLPSEDLTSLRSFQF